MKILNLRPRP